MSLTPAEQKERLDVIGRVGEYKGAVGSPATKHVKRIERQTRRSRLENQRCYIFENTLNSEATEDWFYSLETGVQDEWEALKRRFLERQQPPQFHLDLIEKWEARDQLQENESPEAYSIKS